MLYGAGTRREREYQLNGLSNQPHLNKMNKKRAYILIMGIIAIVVVVWSVHTWFVLSVLEGVGLISGWVLAVAFSALFLMGAFLVIGLVGAACIALFEWLYNE